MSDEAPRLNQLNLVVSDLAASVDFYRRVGADVGEAAGFPHAAVTLPDGFTLEMDGTDSAALWHAGVRADPASGRLIIGFALESREAVDARYTELTTAGYAGRQPPFDAFWGSRYAIVADPDGNDVGLMSPIDDAKRTWPPAQSPDP